MPEVVTWVARVRGEIELLENVAEGVEIRLTSVLPGVRERIEPPFPAIYPKPPELGGPSTAFDPTWGNRIVAQPPRLDPQALTPLGRELEGMFGRLLTLRERLERLKRDVEL